MAYIPELHAGRVVADRYFRLRAWNRNREFDGDSFSLDLVGPEATPSPFGEPRTKWGMHACARAVLRMHPLDQSHNWLDFIEVHQSTSPLAVSSRVARKLDELGVSSYFHVPLELRTIEGESLDGKVPDYRALFPEPLADLEGVEGARNNRDLPRSQLLRVPSGASGDVDLFAYGRQHYAFWERGSSVCSRRIVELARQERWTGVEFGVINLPQSFHAWPRINPLAETWPPRWRPAMPDELSLAGWVENAAGHRPEFGLLFGDVVFALEFHGQALLDAALELRNRKSDRLDDGIARVVMWCFGRQVRSADPVFRVAEADVAWAKGVLGWDGTFSE